MPATLATWRNAAAALASSALLLVACGGKPPPRTPPPPVAGGAAGDPGVGGAAGGSTGGAAGGAGGGAAGAGGAAGGAGGEGAGGAAGAAGGTAGGGGDGAGGGTGGAGADAGAGADGSVQPPEATLTAFAGLHVYHDPNAMPSKRRADAMVTFPDASTAVERVILKVALRCPPAGGCDWWDRRATLGLVHRAGTDEETVVELMRFMTPYRVGATHTLDVTALRPLLTGPVRVRVFIDTWVGPGHANGAGWLVDASFELQGARPPPRRVLAVLPLWSEAKVVYGDPRRPVATAAPPRTVEIPAEAGAVELRSIITGHGQGNAENCAEFCRKTHRFTVGGREVERLVWRDDCARTPVQNQAGNWRPSRAGWCPGAEVRPWVADVSAGAPAGGPVTVSYTVQDYENSCRPDAPVCARCVFGTGCDYNGGNHTEPQFFVSAVLVVYAR